MNTQGLILHSKPIAVVKDSQSLVKLLITSDSIDPQVFNN